MGTVELRARRASPGAIELSFGTRLPRRRTAAVAHAAPGADRRRRAAPAARGATGIVVRCPSNKGLAEEAPFAYKDVDRVVDVVEAAGLARRVARLGPLGVVKG